jgi:UDP:flavonoid glycosyltransferase YjiC (YdhE family)
MRVLFTSCPMSGHFMPMVPLARQIEREGHVVAFCVSNDLAAVVASAGFAVAAVDYLTYEWMLSEGNRRGQARAALVRTERWRNGTSMFAWRAEAFVEPLIDIVDRWQPDVIVHEPAEFAAAIAGTVRGLPHVTHSWGALRETQWGQLRAELMEPVWDRFGLVPLAHGGDYEYLYFDICPPSLRAPELHGIPTAQPLRPDAPGPAAEPPAWLAGLPEDRTLYVTMGTMPANNTQTTLLCMLVEGLARHDVNVIVTVGNNNDPEELGPQPPNVRVERYVAQEDVLPFVAAVICHGGSGTMFGALRHGLPLLMIPLGADQFQNAAACTKAGVGRAVDVETLTADLVTSEAAVLLGDPSYRQRSEAVRNEITTMPGPEFGVRHLSILANS